MTSSQDFLLPQPQPDQAYVEVSALEAGMIDLPFIHIVQGAGPEEVYRCPSLAFSIVHKPSGTHLVFDLGLRRDVEAYPPPVHAIIEAFPFTVPQSAEESLEAGGILPEAVQTVILSHLHHDHVGNPDAFPNATFIVGPGNRELIESGYPTDPKSAIWQSTPVERTRFLSSSDFSMSVGPFPRTYDYFGDGSLYLVDAPGHVDGHINVLARTSRDGSWIFLAGDSAHDTRLLTGEKEVAFNPDASGLLRCVHVHKDIAIEHIRRVGSLLKVPKVHVVLAHDKEWYEKNKGGGAFLPGIIPPA
ncbi:uncharacterized protein PHACADRAFT_159645 [Phanerochaete carnosa HHB-10118-sp]|uniref:Metallo-beta-lactamase domain-containing protein n=1 Tax=Phanerochaete carnosa (strain HHB-10118-sp) TaxID=650164 RepID=K5X6K4_PHACS|nr:uncharacterized protein PHACADRAFT_159645 [Phanerochaete carnosa HHB-10118-sp]EKM58502.1 hypothetical protein PHACADRAFT_159645 [Phanerochaete carnosa HHB-10118-sp]